MFESVYFTRIFNILQNFDNINPLIPGLKYSILKQLIFNHIDSLRAEFIGNFRSDSHLLSYKVLLRY